VTVPDCSPCGLAVDWLRSCYGSEWHFFADSPATKTGGRYYFAPPGTPFVGTSHFYWSRRWLETNWSKIQGLGEDLESLQPWYNGAAPAVLPRATQVGNDLCFNQGDSINNALTTDDMHNGFITSCYSPAVPLDPLWETASSFDICALQFFYATLISWSYKGEFARIATAFTMLLGPDAVTTTVPGTLPLPDVTVCKMPNFSIVVVDGTRDFQTFAMQAFATLVPPLNFGVFSTFGFWYATGNYIRSVIDSLGVDGNAPIFFAGHSYGAVSSDTLIGRYRAGNPARVIRRISFGSPKPGDARLQELLASCPGISLANDDDIVCSVPPNFLTTFPVVALFPLLALSTWWTWVREPNRARQALNGALDFNEDPIIDTPLLTHLINQIVALQPFDVIDPHFIDAYRARIETRCPDPAWPISAALWNYLHGIDPRPGTLLGLGGETAPEHALALAFDNFRIGLGLADLPIAVGTLRFPEDVPPGPAPLELTGTTWELQPLGLVDWYEGGAIELTAPDLGDGQVGLDMGQIADCDFCGDDPMPAQVRMVFDVPDFPSWDGHIMHAPVASGPGDCSYTQFNSIVGEGDLSLSVDFADANFPDMFWIILFHDGSGNAYSTTLQVSTDYVCYPFGAAGSAELLLNGVTPTGFIIAWQIFPEF
jgi:hypothetical protein